MANRIRYVPYLSRTDVSSTWVKAVLLGHFIRDQIDDQAGLSREDGKTLKDEKILQPILERAFTALNGNYDLPVEAIRAVIEGPLSAAGEGDRVERLVLSAKQIVDASLTTMNQHIDQFAPLQRDAYVPQWKLGEALLPFTETSLTTPVMIRECWCGCWIRDGETVCPCCGWAAPGGRARRAWERQQIQFQPLGQPNAPAPAAAPGVLPKVVQEGLAFGFRVTSKTTLLLDEADSDDEFALHEEVE